MRKWHLASPIVLFILIGCTVSPPIVTVQSVWPDLPDVPALPTTNLKPVQYTKPTANSFIAMDYDNWLNFQYNWEVLSLQQQLYNQRIAEVNNQRAEWRKLNEQNHASSSPAK